MPRKLLRRFLPERKSLDRFQFLRHFAPYLNRPELWAIRRNLIAGGLAIGLFCAMIPGPLQMLAAISLAILFRLNLPVAVLGTLVSNPFTIVPLYLVAYVIGQWCNGMADSATLPALPATDWDQPRLALSLWSEWIMTLGAPLATGIFILALVLAIAGYTLVQLGWRLNIQLALRRRRYNQLNLASARAPN
jgi:uncharacterized protein (DUF2062 family)